MDTMETMDTMFKLESNRLKREFKITNNTFYASQILNKYSDMSFVPDGNGCEFVIFFEDGDEFSSKGLPVVSSREENKKLTFVFAENKGVTVELAYWVHADGNTVCKQITLNQKDDRVIDCVLLDNIGIVNSKTHFGVDGNVSQKTPSLGQPFYIDSLFFGCEFPAADSRIRHGAGQIKYYIGKSVGNQFRCPVTVMGGGADNTVQDVKKAFFEYIDFISVKRNPCLHYANEAVFADNKKAGSEAICADFSAVLQSLNAPDMPSLSAAVISSDNWASAKADFWECNKYFPNGLADFAAVCESNHTGAGLALQLDGISRPGDGKKLAKKMQKAQNGFVHSENKMICTASAVYHQRLAAFLGEMIKQYHLSYLSLSKLDNAPCTDESHDHAVGGKNNLYYYCDMWQKHIALLEALRNQKPDLWINLRVSDVMSPWLLQWVNSFDIESACDIDEATNYEEQPAAEAALTLCDTVYYNQICEKALQLPLNALRGNAPSTAAYCAELDDTAFAKYILWSMVRGNIAEELHLSLGALSPAKRAALSKALSFRENNWAILQNASFIGGNPNENNIYGYVAWCESGDGIVALRNPTKEKTDLTLTLNKLMGVPKNLNETRVETVFGEELYTEALAYNSKLDISLPPFACIILKFTK